MPATLSQMGIDKLDESQRIDLAIAIWDSLDDTRSVANLTDRQRSELKHRDAELDAHPEIAIPWSEIRRRVEKPK